MQTDDRDIKNIIKGLIKYNYYFILTLLFLLLIFREYFPKQITFAIILIIVVDIIVDFTYGIIDKISETFYLSYIKDFRRLISYALASRALIIDYPSNKQISSFTDFAGILILMVIFIIYMATIEMYFKDFKNFLTEKIQNTESARYIDSIFWLSIIFTSGILKSSVIAIAVISALTNLYLIRLRDKQSLNPVKYQTYSSIIRVTFPLLIVITAIIECKLKLHTSHELIGSYILFLLLRILSIKQPEPEYRKAIYKRRGGIKYKPIDPTLRNKYSEKIYDLSFVLSELDQSKLREYYKNVKKVIPTVSNEKLFGVLPKLNISEHTKSELFRLDNENYKEMLAELNIPDNTKADIEKLLEEKTERIIIISEAAFETDWVYGRRYLIFEVAEKDRLTTPLLQRNLIKSQNSYSQISMQMDISLLLNYKSKTNEYIKRVKSIKAGFSTKKSILIYGKNLEKLLPVLNIPGKVKNEFEEKVKNNKIILVSEAAFLPEWKWDEKYIVIDPEKTLSKDKEIPMRRRILTESAIYLLAIGISTVIHGLVISVLQYLIPSGEIYGGTLFFVLWPGIIVLVTYLLIRVSNSKGIITSFEDTIKPVTLTALILGGLIVSVFSVISRIEMNELPLPIYQILLIFPGLFLLFYFPSILAKKK